jgi:hypothetical protein
MINSLKKINRRAARAFGTRIRTIYLRDPNSAERTTAAHSLNTLV